MKGFPLNTCSGSELFLLYNFGFKVSETKSIMVGSSTAILKVTFGLMPYFLSDVILLEIAQGVVLVEGYDIVHKFVLFCHDFFVNVFKSDFDGFQKVELVLVSDVHVNLFLVEAGIFLSFIRHQIIIQFFARNYFDLGIVPLVNNWLDDLV